VARSIEFLSKNPGLYVQQRGTFWGRQAVIRDTGGANIGLRVWRAPDGPHFDGWQPE
jgi:hypothetical protein